MLDLKLFLGFCPDESFEKELRQANPYLSTLLIGKEEYLQQITYNKQHYLGKTIHIYPTLNQLEDLERHVLSLLRKLTPNYSFVHNPVRLVTFHVQ